MSICFTFVSLFNWISRLRDLFELFSFQAAERLIFDHRLSYEKGKPIVMKDLYEKVDKAIEILNGCSRNTRIRNQ